MATYSSGDHNLDLSKDDNKNSVKRKQTRTRSRAYRRRRALKRRKQSVNHRKIIEKYLKNKPNRLEMLTDVIHENFKRDHHGNENRINKNPKINELAIFWKSKALSLELENKMLMKHIEDLYRQIIASKNPNQNYKYDETQALNDQEYQDYDDDDYEYSEMDETETQDDVPIEKTDSKNEEKMNTEFPKIIEDKKQRETEMKILYGKSFRKIMGMETVVQMQYDILLDKEKINYWPVLPIKM